MNLKRWAHSKDEGPNVLLVDIKIIARETSIHPPRKCLQNLSNFQIEMSGGKSRAKLRRSKLDQHAMAKRFLELSSTRLCLSSLNTDVLNHLLLFLDGPSLQQLAKTCTLFHQLINGQAITNLHVPFSMEFLHEVNNAEAIEKKPVLRITLSESYLETYLGARPGFNGLCSRAYVTSLLNYQLSLLDLTKLRDLVIKPSTGDHAFSGSCNIFFKRCSREIL